MTVCSPATPGMMPLTPITRITPASRIHRKTAMPPVTNCSIMRSVPCACGRFLPTQPDRLYRSAALAKAIFQPAGHAQPDPSIVVIYEIVGMWISLAGVGTKTTGVGRCETDDAFCARVDAIDILSVAKCLLYYVNEVGFRSASHAAWLPF